MTTQDSLALTDPQSSDYTAKDHEDDGPLCAEKDRDVEKRGGLAITSASSLDDGEARNTDREQPQPEERPNGPTANVVDYDGPDDPENPYNWTKTRKWINGGFISAMTLVTYVQSLVMLHCSERRFFQSHHLSLRADIF